MVAEFGAYKLELDTEIEKYENLAEEESETKKIYEVEQTEKD